jgi:hypothetical protein
MDNFVNLNLLTPPNAVIVVLILIFMSYAGFVVYSNAGQLIPKL